ncbi:MAG: enoyl-CoA hydratase/isomerase family protein [Alphaproteobacteria bacterium]
MVPYIAAPEPPLLRQEHEPMTYQFLKIDVQGPAAWIEFDNPPRNAINWEMLEELPKAIRSCDLNPAVRVIVIASSLEKYFSVGADLSLFDGIDQDGMRRWMEHCHALVHEMRRSSKPLLAAIAGVAVGAGFEVTFHCDVRFAADTARFGQPEISIGLLPGVGATQALARLLGRTRAIRFLYEGTLIDAEEARSIGLADFVVPTVRLRQEVQTYAERLSGKPKEVLAAIRKTITLGGSIDFDAGLALELEAEVELAGTENFREGIAAFRAKRQPSWR